MKGQMGRHNSRPEKKPRGAERPFPWVCRHCGETRVVPVTTDYATEAKYDGALISFAAKEVEIPTCESCGEKVFTEDVDRQINEALRNHLGLLMPGQIRENVDAIGLSQKEASRRLGVAEATLSRWINGVVIQSRAMDNLLRLFFGFPVVRDALCGGFHSAGLDEANALAALQVPKNVSPRNNRYCTHGHRTTPWAAQPEETRKSCRPLQTLIEQAGSAWSVKRAVG